jgi:hypothetical protein
MEQQNLIGCRVKVTIADVVVVRSFGYAKQPTVVSRPIVESADTT